jgi:peptide/nickel transport system substrate-binding protein
MRQWISFSALLACSVLVLSGCGTPPPEPGNISDNGNGDEFTRNNGSTQYKNILQTMIPIEERDKGGHIIDSLDAEPAHLNIHLDTADASGAYITGFIFEGLLKIDSDSLEIIPHIAKSWDISEDKLTYTFHLRDDVHFSDNVPLTAHDVKFSHDVVMDPTNDTAAGRSLRVDIESATVLDDYTIQFKVNKPYIYHLVVMGGNEIYPKHIYGKGEFNNHPNNRAPVGSGPYTFDSWTTGQQIVLARNENYWGPKQPLAKRVWKLITDDNAAFQALERGDTDRYLVKPDAWNRKASKPAFEENFNKFTPDSPIPGYFSRYNYIGWNIRKPQFEDKRVRRALCMLFDRQSIIENVWGGLGSVITGSVFHKMPEYDKSIEPWPFDHAGAIKLLDEAGWVDTDKDGFRDKNGIRLEFRLSYASGITEYERLGSIYKEELERAGILMELDPIEWATFQERVHKRNFDACMLAWVTSYIVDGYPLWHSSQIEKGRNYPGLARDDLDTLLEDYRVEFDKDKRIAMSHKVHSILHEEQPYLFLYARPGLVAMDKRIHGVIEHTGGFDAEDWWIPTAEQKYR